MIKLYKKYIKNKMVNKMLLIYSVITIVAIFLLTNIFINYYIDNELENELDIHSEVMFNIEKRFEEQNSISNSVANGINTQTKITDEINVLTTSTYEEYLSYKLDNFMLTNIKQIDLKYLLDTVLANRNDVLAVVINDKNKEYKNEIVMNYDKWYDLKNILDEDKYTRKITKPIKNVDSMYTIGYIDIYFDLSNLNKIINNSNLKGSIVILDENNNVMFDSNKILSKEDIDKIKNKEPSIISNLNTDIGILKEKYPIINIKEDAQTGFKYGSIITQKDLDTNDIKGRIVFISLVCIFIILFVTYILISIYSLKLKKMMKVIGKIKNGDLSARFNIVNEEDELDMIAIRIDQMSESLEYNINKNYISEVKQKQAEINALQAQIKPHFLYNTLEVIRMCALSSKNTEVAQMIYNLASMFRYSTYNNGTLVTLSDEIKHCKMYLSLCNTRYKGIMDYKVDIDDKFLSYLVPKFTVQPILENSINHGLRKDYSENLISINLIEIKDGVELIITDNGSGINKEKLNEIEVDLEKNLQKSSSIGLMNINNRLKLKFGNYYGVSIESKESEGTTVKIKLPILRDEDEHV